MMIGREKQKEELCDLLSQDESQFVAIYGRRRIGKTYLVHECFQSKFAFHYTGVINLTRKEQLENFYAALLRQGLKGGSVPKTWFEAFELLRDLLEQEGVKTVKGKKVIFLDELPWMDSPRSRFVAALSYFWNSWAAWTHDIILVVCGSATSWIISKIVKDRGGLHNRLTRQIYLMPFTLRECEQYCEARCLKLNQGQIAELYMIFGGIPYYWSLLEKGRSVAQNVDRLCFSEDGALTGEFDKLYSSMFKKPAEYVAIVKALGSKKAGMTRDELIAKTRLPNNGRLTEVLENLDHCGFIRTFYPFGKKERGSIYQLMDNFTLFYFHFMANRRNVDTTYWNSIAGTPIHNVWVGLAFERLCLQHLPQIRWALGIGGVAVATHSWQTDAKHSSCGEGAQIDLVMVRSDNLIDLFEMKYSSGEYHITKEFEEKIRNVTDNFISTTGTRRGVRNVLVTTYGVYNNQYRWTFSDVVTLNRLFEK